MFEEFRKLLIRHMMRSVNDRYLVLRVLGMEERLMASLSLEGSAWAVGMTIADHMKSWYGKDETFEGIYKKLSEVPLPEWMTKELSS